MLAIQSLAGGPPELQRGADVGRGPSPDLGVEGRDLATPVGQRERGGDAARSGLLIDDHVGERQRRRAAWTTMTRPRRIRRTGHRLPQRIAGIAIPSVRSRKYQTPIASTTSPKTIDAKLGPRSRCRSRSAGSHGGSRQSLTGRSGLATSGGGADAGISPADAGPGGGRITPGASCGWVSSFGSVISAGPRAGPRPPLSYAPRAPHPP